MLCVYFLSKNLWYITCTCTIFTLLYIIHTCTTPHQVKKLLNIIFYSTIIYFFPIDTFIFNTRLV